LIAYATGEWVGDSLDNFYNVGGSGLQNELVYGISTANDKREATFDFSCSATLGGQPIPLQGLVIADAESSTSFFAEGSFSTTAYPEYVEARPTNSTSDDGSAPVWRVIEKMRQEPCTSTSTATLDSTNKLQLAPTNGSDQCSGSITRAPWYQYDRYGPAAVAFLEGATAAEVGFRGNGRSAIALGVMLSADFGDAPRSYGVAGALYQPVWNGGTITGSQNLWQNGFQLATPSNPDAPLLGSRVDPEASPYFSDDATGDDTHQTSGEYEDEDALASDTLELSDMEGGDSYELTNVVCSSDAGGGYVTGWIDWDHDGEFDEQSEASETVECVDGSVDLEWTVPEDLQYTADGALTFLRLRIAESVAESQQATGIVVTGSRRCRDRTREAGCHRCRDAAFGREVPALGRRERERRDRHRRPGHRRRTRHRRRRRDRLVTS
jgi:hypothetical protein